MRRLTKTILFILIGSLMLMMSCAGDLDVPQDEQPETTTEQTTTSAQTETTTITEEIDTDRPYAPVSSTFYNRTVMENIKKNAETVLEFRAAARIAENDASRYMETSYDQLWEFVVGPELERSWMVLSDGDCPSCGEPVVMYNWIIDPVEHPFKLQCPQCQEFFPKNDFEAFYRSGLDERGRFDADLADRSLLYNAETGDPNDLFGVDDGTGYEQDGKVYRFIQTYLVYGQWKRTVLDGINRLSTAYIYTQEPEYGVRALILLDRLADFFPEYDYGTQGWLYEQLGLSSGYVSYRIDSAFEVYDLAKAYDRVIEVLFMDTDLVDFLSQKAEEVGLENRKQTPADIMHNIETRILKDALENRHKILSNEPYTDVAKLVIRAVLDWPSNREELEDEIAALIEHNTRVDGMTGESGLTGYTTMGKTAIARLCNLFVKADPDFIKNMYERVPKLYDAYRFHIDVHCVNRYYPLIGDAGYFGHAHRFYPNTGGIENRMLYELYTLTQDKDLIRTIYNTNRGQSRSSMSHFVEMEDVAAVYAEIDSLIAEHGREIDLGSIRKDEWQLAILRTGTGHDKTELWINFGTNKVGHDHGDGMNIGMYYMDADMMPDNGYPNVAYGGGWNSDIVRWTMGTISHNVISFNHQRHRRADGTLTLWTIGDTFKVLRANAPETFTGVKRYERSLALVDINHRSAYVLDVFRTGEGPAGSYEKYSRSNISDMQIHGLSTQPTDRIYPNDVFMSNFRQGSPTGDVWSANWSIRDVFNMIQYGHSMNLKMFEMTADANFFLSDTWLPPSMGMLAQGHEGFQLPTVITERTVDEGETATFVSVLEPYSRQSQIESVQRLQILSTADDTHYDSNVAVSVRVTDRFTDYLIMLDHHLDPMLRDVLVQTDIGPIKTNAQAVLVRVDLEENLIMIRASMGDYVRIDGQEYEIDNTQEPTYIDFDNS